VRRALSLSTPALALLLLLLLLSAKPLLLAGSLR
jgi:hypothetical protein